MLKQRIEQDLKTALLGGDRDRAMTLRSMKSVILYAEVEKGVREKGLDDDLIIGLLAKEAKKRQDSADLYEKANETERANKELQEKAIIEEYLPQQLSDEELGKVVDEVISQLAVDGSQAMGQVIGQVKQRTAGQADGARIAQLARERLQ